MRHVFIVGSKSLDAYGDYSDLHITKVGKFIGKTSADEFPWFWNDLKGDRILAGTGKLTEV